jgi:hypothetical protein
MKTRNIFLALGVLALGILVAACSSPSPAPPPVITVINYPTPVAPTPTADNRPPTAAPPTAPPTPVAKRITFAPGGISATVTGSTFTPGQDHFVIRALAGQTMTATVTATQGPVILILYGADGNVLISDHAGATTWSGELPSTQDYYIDTRSVGANVVPFTLTVTIPPK